LYEAILGLNLHYVVFPSEENGWDWFGLDFLVEQGFLTGQVKTRIDRQYLGRPSLAIRVFPTEKGRRLLESHC